MKIPADFDAEIWSVVAEIPAGRVATYGQLARLIGMPGHARRAGRALALAPEGLPCHRVVNSQGRTAPGWTGQRELLGAFSRHTAAGTSSNAEVRFLARRYGITDRRVWQLLKQEAELPDKALQAPGDALQG